MNRKSNVVSLHRDRNQQVRQRRIHANARSQWGSRILPFGWQSLIAMDAPPEGSICALENGRCTVIGREVPHPFHAHDGSKAIELEIVEKGRPLLWEEMQQVKIEAVPEGDKRWAWEVFPSVTCELVGARYRLLMVLLPGEEMPGRRLPPAEKARREREMQVLQEVATFVAEHHVQVLPAGEDGTCMRVFFDMQDAIEAGIAVDLLQEKSLEELPAADREGLAWSDRAKELRNRVLDEMRAMYARLMQQEIEKGLDEKTTDEQ